MFYATIAASPDSGKKLFKREDSFLSEDKKEKFYIDDGIVNLLPKKNDQFRDIEEKFWDYTYEHEESRKISNRNSSFHEHFRRLLILLPPNTIVVELGCGTRLDALEIAQTGKHVIATDISLEALKKARKLAQSVGIAPNIDFIRAEASHLPMLNDSVDGVLIAAAFHHLQNPLDGLKEIRRIVKNGGYVVLGVEPNSWPYKTVYKILHPLKMYIRKKRNRGMDSIADDETKGFSKRDLKKIFQDAHINIIEIKPVKFTLEWYDQYLRLKGRIFRKEFSPNLFIYKLLECIDSFLERIPIVNHFFWHWNVIGRVKK